MLALNNVTLVAYETRYPNWAEWSLKKSLDIIRPSKTILFTTAQCDSARFDERIEIRYTNGTGITGYNHFVLRQLPHEIQTDFVLVSQWDGFVVNGAAWLDEFLDYDYIGAPWPHHPNSPVGNGGFSLRSARLLRAQLSEKFIVTDYSRPEDAVICHDNKAYFDNIGVRFASLQIAREFSTENLTREQTTGALDRSLFPERLKSFGFHGFFNFPLALTEQELELVLQGLPNKLFASHDGFRLVEALIRLRLSGSRLGMLKRLMSRKMNRDTVKLAIAYLMKK